MVDVGERGFSLRAHYPGKGRCSRVNTKRPGNRPGNAVTVVTERVVPCSYRRLAVLLSFAFVRVTTHLQCAMVTVVLFDGK